MRKTLFFIKIFLLMIVISSISFINVNAAYDSSLEENDIPTNYYQNVDLSLTGADFRQNLSEIISAGYVKYKYSSSSSTDVYDILIESDADPNGDGVVCIYSKESLNITQVNGILDWDKEHVWAKSHGFPADPYENSAPYSDAHHLRPCIASVNRSRSNLDFGEITSGGTADAYGNIKSETLFEPNDAAKGDVARMMFYMATRYGFDGQFNLTLTNDTTTSASTLNGVFGNLDTLIKWHYEDPVSTSEIYRNNVIYKYQKNRNPYIDHPEYVGYAYPNSYADYEVDQTKVNNVINLINTIPSEVTLENKDLINSIKAAYDALNPTEKQSVTNYTVLNSAIVRIEYLENLPTEDDTEETGYNYEYKFSSNMYTATNETKSLGDIDWKLDFTGGKISTFDANKGLHLGTNSDACTSVSLVSGKTLYKVSKVVINASGNSSVNATIKCNVGSSTGSSYSLTSTPTDYTFNFNKASGAISIIMNNSSQKALYILSIKIVYEIDYVPQVDNFISNQTMGGLYVSYMYPSLQLVDVDLRFGGIISEDSYLENAKYGVIIVKSDNEEMFTEGKQEYSTALDYVGENNYLECQLTELETGYELSFILDDIISDDYNSKYTAVIYMEYNENLYFAKSITYSIEDIAKIYVLDNIVTNEDIVSILKSIYE